MERADARRDACAARSERPRGARIANYSLAVVYRHALLYYTFKHIVLLLAY